MKHLSNKIIFALIAATLVLVVVISVFYAIIKISPTQLQQIVTAKIEDTTGQNVSIGNATVQIFLRPKLSLEDVRIGQPDEMYIDARKIEARFSLWSLMTGKMRVSSLVFIHPSVFLNTEALKKRKDAGKSITFPSIEIIDGALWVQYNGADFIIEKIEGLIGPETLDFKTSVLGGATKVYAAYHEGWKGSISSKRIDLSILREDLQGLCDLDVTFDLRQAKMDSSVAVNAKNLSLPWITEEIGTCSLHLETQGDTEKIKLEKLSFTIPQAQISGSGEIIEPKRKKDAHIKLGLASTEFDYEQVIHMLPTHTFYPWLETLLDSQIRNGRSRFSSIRYDGSIQGFLDSRAFFNNAYIVQDLIGQSFGAGYGPERITDITGKVIYGEGDIAFKGLNGIMGDSEIESMDLIFHDVALPESKVSVKVKADMPARDFVDAWRAAMVPEDQYNMLSPVSKITNGRVRGHVSTFWDEISGKPLQVLGDIWLESLNYFWGDTMIQDHSGNISAQDFDSPMKISFTGKANSNSIKRFDCILNEPFGEMTSSFSVETDYLPEPGSLRLGEGSRILVDGTGTGPKINADITIQTEEITLFDSTYSSAQGFIKATGKLTGTLRPELELDIRDLKPQLPSSSLSISASISDNSSNARIKGQLDLEHLTAVIDNKKQPLKGSLAGDINIVWEKKLELTGSLMCNKAVLFINGSSLTLDGPISMQKNSLLSENFNIKTDDITIGIKSGSLSLYKRPYFTGRLFIEGMKLTSQGTDKNSHILNSLDADSPIELVNIDFRGIEMDSAKAYAELRDGTLTLSGMKIKGPSGTAQGSVTLNQFGTNTFDIVVSLNNANINQFFSAFAQEESWIRGDMNLNGHLWGSTESINGSLVLTARDGRIKKYALTSRIFALLNIYKIIQSHDIELTSKNFPYNMITSTFSIRDSMVSFDDFYFDSNSLQLSAVGQYSLRTEELDSIIGVQPFETIDKAIGMIPLLGWVLTGDDKKLIIVSMRVQGKIDDPTVGIAPMETISKPVEESLFRVFELSSDIIKKSQKIIPHKKDK